jgi:hypothetical protein
MGLMDFAVQTAVLTLHSPIMTTPLGSTFIAPSFLAGIGQPTYQTVSRVFHQVLPVLRREGWYEGGTQAGFGFVEENVRVSSRSPIPNLESLGVGELVSIPRLPQLRPRRTESGSRRGR